MDITIPVERIRALGITINEYLILYDLTHDNEITNLLDFTLQQLVKLEQKGYIRIEKDGIIVRAKTTALFAIDGTEDLFVVWLSKYPTKVKTSRGGSRALSPASENTIMGKNLRKKWVMTFKKDTEAMLQAIKVLELEVEDKKKSGDLEYMVEASRWLNQGYFEKYAYLIEDDKGKNEYENEDYY